MIAHGAQQIASIGTTVGTLCVLLAAFLREQRKEAR